MSENAHITRSFGIVGIATFASRILGLIREMAIAFYFGASMASDAFFVAFQIPNILRILLAEGSLSIAFIPVFSETLVKKGRDEALKLAHVTFTILTIILIIITVLGIIFASPLIKIMVPGKGFAEIPGKTELTILLTQITFPFIFLVSLAALCMGILNSLRRFAAPALAPAFYNLGVILSVVLLFPYLHFKIMALAIGVMVGGFLQLVYQIPSLEKNGVHLTSNFDFQNPGLKKMGKIMAPAIFGSAIYQIKILINTVLASSLPQGSISYLNYAYRLLEFPLGVFVYSISSVVLPSFSTLAASNEMEKLKETFVFSLRLAMFIVIPAMVGLASLGIPIISVLLQRGSFTPEQTVQTSIALFYYSLGLWAISGLRITVQVFYSLHDTKTPVKVGVINLLTHVLLSIVLMGPLKHGGLALALSLSSVLHFLILLMYLRRKIGRLGMRAALPSLVKIVFASLVMGGVCYGICSQVNWLTPGDFYKRIAYLAGAIGSGALVFFGLCFLLRCPELETLKDVFKKKMITPSA
jgi:putative peptidoglycan lipid II flippase